MTFVQRRQSTRKPQTRPLTLLRPTSSVTPEEQQRAHAAQVIHRLTTRPMSAQRQVVQAPLWAAALERQEVQRVHTARQAAQRQLASLGLAPDAVEAPLAASAPGHLPTDVPARPVRAGDWVTVLRARAQEVEGQPLDSRAYAAFTALQRQVAHTLAQGFRQDRSPAQARAQTYGEHLAVLQGHPISAPVARVILGLVPAADRLTLQRAVETAVQRAAEQQAHDARLRQAVTLQRQLAELAEEATQPVLARIQARRGAGHPLPDAVRRHLEQGLNHDLGRVRIHDDAEADTLAKGVGAIAFTTGTDIFFQRGRFNPNTRSGLELLAHEVTHTVQQSQGRVGPGLDPDAGLEAEARTSGARLARSFTPASFLKLAPAPATRVSRTLAPLTPVHAAQRLVAGQTIQCSVWGDWWKTFQDKALETALEVAARVPNGPTIVAAFKRSQAVFGKIMANPGGFFKNLMGAAVNGFTLFRTNIAGHLRTALLDWLTGTTVAATGGTIAFPKSLDGKALLGFGMNLLGLNTATLVARLGKRYGAQNVQKVQGQLAILQQAKGGLHQLNEFRRLDGKAKDGLMSAARGYAIQTVVQQAVTWVSSFIVTGGLGPVAKAAFALISTFLNNAQTFGQVAGGVLDSLQDIAGGQVLGAAKKVEQNLGRVTGLVLKFVSRLLGLDKLGGALRRGLSAVQKPINAAIDKIVGSKPVQTVFQKLKAAGGTVAAQARGGLKNLWAGLSGSNRMLTSRLPVKGTKHHLWVEIRGQAPVVIMASNPLPLREQLVQMEKEASAFLTGPEKAAVDQAQAEANQLVDAGVQGMLTYIQTRPRGANPAADEAWLRANTATIRGKLANMGKDTITQVNARIAPAVAILDRHILSDQDFAGVITSAGGIVAFLQQIAAGRTVSGINKAKLAALWDRTTGGQVRHRETLIRLFRAALSGHHEWIPSDLMMDVVERDFDLHQFGQARFWIDLQHQTRTKTQYLVFKKVEMEGGQAVIQGHSGSVYRKETTLQGTARYLPAVVGQAGFHNALRGAFKGGSDRQAVMQGLASTVQQYIWDGSAGVFPQKIHPDSFWRSGQGQYVSFQNSFPTIQQAIQTEYAAILQLLRS